MDHHSSNNYYYGVNHQSNVHANNPYVQITPTPASGSKSMDKLCDVMNRCGKKVGHATRKAETLADNVWHHLKVSPSFADAAMARLTQGTKLLTEGGYDKMFQHQFSILPGEKLLHAYVCYLSTSTGPVSGTLYISTKRVAFCSDNPLHRYSPTGQPETSYYKVVMQHDQLRSVNPSTNPIDPSERYINVITRDGFEFWFMGFLSYDRALKSMSEALHRYSH